MGFLKLCVNNLEILKKKVRKSRGQFLDNPSKRHENIRAGNFEEKAEQEDYVS